MGKPFKKTTLHRDEIYGDYIMCSATSTGVNAQPSLKRVNNNETPKTPAVPSDRNGSLLLDNKCLLKSQKFIFCNAKDLARVAQASKVAKHQAHDAASQLCIFRSVKLSHGRNESVELSHGRNEIEKLYLIEKVDSFIQETEDFYPSVLKFSRLKNQLIQLAADDPSVTSLYYSNKLIGDDIAKMIAIALTGNTSLEILFLNRCDIGNDGAKALAAAVKDHPSLDQLWLDYNDKIGDAGAIALATALRENPILTCLSILCRDIGVNGKVALKALLDDGPQINRQIKGISFPHYLRSMNE